MSSLAPKRTFKWANPYNRVSRAQLRDTIERRYRTPFGDVLTELLRVRPDTETLLSWAAAYPEKWATAVSIFARLAGYSDKLEIEESLNINISNLSDAALLQKLSELRTLFDVKAVMAPIDSSIQSLDSKIIEHVNPIKYDVSGD